MKIDFVTLGGASKRLKVPPPTLRNWTDQLEEYGTHYTKRNNRNERIYYEKDLEIFKYLRDMKHEHGRKTTTERLARILSADERFELRNKADAPSPVEEPSNRMELLNQEDIKELMDSERVQQFVRVIVDQTTKNIKDDLINELTENLTKEVERKLKDVENKHKKEMDKLQKGQEEILSRVETYGRNSEKGFWSRLIGK